MSKALELPQDVKDRLAELQALSERAEAGDKSARKELRKAVRESAPEIIFQNNLLWIHGGSFVAFYCYVHTHIRSIGGVRSQRHIYA